MYETVQPTSDELRNAIITLTDYKWSHGERHKRVMSLDRVLEERLNSFPKDEEAYCWPFCGVVEWNSCRIYFPRKNNEGIPVCSVVIKSADKNYAETDLTTLIWLLMGRISCP